jgi:colicin import membrane protein
MAKSGPVERASDRWISIVLSVLLHGALVAAVVYGWWSYRHDRPAPTLAIEATVVDAKSVPGIGKLPPPPEPPPPPQPPDTQPQVEPEGPPPPTPEELAKREQEQKEQAAQAEQQEKEQKEQEHKAALAEQKRQEEQKKAQEKAETERKAHELAEAKKKAEEQKRLEEERQKAEQQANAQREADLRRSLDQEVRRDAARDSAAMASWESQIVARITRAWLRPPSARQGIVCELNVTQEPGGKVTNVHIGACNGDAAVRESIEAAVYRASPLPSPPDPSLFEPSLDITFRPD